MSLLKLRMLTIEHLPGTEKKRKRRKEKKAHINWNATWSFTPVACPGAAAELVSKVLGRIPSLNISSESLSADLLQLFGDSSKCPWCSSAGGSSATIQLQSYMKLHGNLHSTSDTVCRYWASEPSQESSRAHQIPRHPTFTPPLATSEGFSILNITHRTAFKELRLTFKNYSPDAICGGTYLWPQPELLFRIGS